MDPELGLPWPTGITPILSTKDREAPSLADAVAAGLLPRWDDCRRHYRTKV